MRGVTAHDTAQAQERSRKKQEEALERARVRREEAWARRNEKLVASMKQSQLDARSAMAQQIDQDPYPSPSLSLSPCDCMSCSWCSPLQT